MRVVPGVVADEQNQFEVVHANRDDAVHITRSRKRVVVVVLVTAWSAGARSVPRQVEHELGSWWRSFSDDGGPLVHAVDIGDVRSVSKSNKCGEEKQQHKVVMIGQLPVLLEASLA